MHSENNKDDLELVTIRLKEQYLEDIDDIVEETEEYGSRSEFIRESIKAYDPVIADYELLLDAAYRAKSQWERSEDDYPDQMMYSLGEHIGKLEILNKLDNSD